METEFGTIKIGWRKRVININWSDVAKKLEERGYENASQKILALFESEDVTKDGSNIHAWGYEKAKGYLRQIRKYLKSLE
ncbi:MAG: hypothetical protein WC242_03245 [Candidatus Paceibacterota bacterium]|jgi:hypothetical protein